MANPHNAPGDVDYASVAQRQKGPFYEVTTLIAAYELDTISLYEMAGMPYLSIVQQPKSIVIVDLTNDTISTLECYNHVDYPANVWFQSHFYGYNINIFSSPSTLEQFAIFLIKTSYSSFVL